MEVGVTATSQGCWKDNIDDVDSDNDNNKNNNTVYAQ